MNGIFSSLKKINQKGMTLLEIMIVLMIIGGLAAVLLPTVMSRLDKSKFSQTKLIMGQIAQALNLYYTDCGKYPPSLDGLSTADSACSNWGPDPYMKKVPPDAWSNGFVYESSGGTYNLKSLGADGKEGGDGKNKDITAEELQ
jgi:general secretion pathway protein G